MEVTNTSGHSHIWLCCKFTRFFLKACGTSLWETHGFRESPSLCIVNFQKRIRVLALLYPFLLYIRQASWEMTGAYKVPGESF